MPTHAQLLSLEYTHTVHQLLVWFAQSYTLNLKTERGGATPRSISFHAYFSDAAKRCLLLAKYSLYLITLKHTQHFVYKPSTTETFWKHIYLFFSLSFLSLYRSAIADFWCGFLFLDMAWRVEGTEPATPTAVLRPSFPSTQLHTFLPPHTHTNYKVRHSEAGEGVACQVVQFTSSRQTKPSTIPRDDDDS